ncbi:MAG: SDR family oxidoreductase [Sphingomonadales bacterium]|nr:SDR family oxidoreductase [Sphingomonadales bacterium]
MPVSIMPDLRQGCQVDALDQILSVNLRGAFLTAREGARRMIAAGPQKDRNRAGSSSSPRSLARGAQAGNAAYSATKAGLPDADQIAPREWARHEINVNAILPRLHATDIVADWFASDAGKASGVDDWPRKRLMPVSDLDPALLFLLSPQARSVSGGDLT